MNYGGGCAAAEGSLIVSQSDFTGFWLPLLYFCRDDTVHISNILYPAVEKSVSEGTV